MRPVEPPTAGESAAAPGECAAGAKRERARSGARSIARDPAERWFAERGWRPFAFQRDCWRAIAAGRSGLLHAATGTGKTYALWFGALRRAARLQPAAGGMRILWLTPMRALAADTARALAEGLSAYEGVGGRHPWTVAMRTGDTSAAERQRQMRRAPFALVTTPESLSLMLSRADAGTRLGGVHTVVVDEWHELLGSKRGTQTQLAIARLRSLAPGLSVWGLSATLSNLDDAVQALCGSPLPACPVDGAAARDAPVVVRGARHKRIVVDALLPESTERFPWGGHLGIRMLAPVVAEIDASASTLVFCNTRSQAELWYQALLDARPDWAGLIALHHGSLDRKVRDWVEAGLKQGNLKAVVCTSSLDLGVDFSPVERVLQVGSAKGVARLLQRAGRSGHGPGRTSRVTLVPTNAFELIEAAAARDAVAAGEVEPREAPVAPLDVLVQHIVTVAAGQGFARDELLAEVRRSWAYRSLDDDAFAWAMDFAAHGGRSLAAYPEYHRIEPDASGRWRVPDAAIARRHRMSIGTIVSESSMLVRFLSGGRIGTIEERFIARLSRGDRFLFGGRLLELVKVHEMTAYVKRAQGGTPAVPRWAGGTMPLSSRLADAVLARLAQAGRGRFEGPEMQLLRPLLALQARWSALPTPEILLVERWRSREGHHLFVYPFAGRHAHLGLGSLLAWRLARTAPATFSIAVNDYGLELLSPQPIEPDRVLDPRLLDDTGLAHDVAASLNSGELAQRRFREIARVAGLVFQGYPGAPRSTRQLQASSGLLYEVFRKHDADNRLLAQADREVLEQELDLERLAAALASMRSRRLEVRELERPTPFAFPLLVERLREKLSTEKLADRVQRMLADLESADDRARA